LAAACALGLISVVWFEGIKWMQRRRKRSGPTSGAPGSAADGQSIA
jgi:predicted outer membrane lipoprotein